MKRIYKKPTSELLEFTTIEVITTSGNEPGLDIGGGFE